MWIFFAGVARQVSEARNQATDGKAERLHRTFLNMARSMIFARKLPLSFWGDAVEYSALGLQMDLDSLDLDFFSDPDPFSKRILFLDPDPFNKWIQLTDPDPFNKWIQLTDPDPDPPRSHKNIKINLIEI